MAADSPRWVNVTRAQPCGICGKPDWCSRSADGQIQLCRRQQGPGAIERKDSSGGVYWLHFARDYDRSQRDRVEQASQEKEPDEAIQYKYERADADTLHAVYMDLLGQLDLLPGHEEHLRNQRKLDPEFIKDEGYKSLPIGGSQRRGIAAALTRRFGRTLLSVPGFFGTQVPIQVQDTHGLPGTTHAIYKWRIEIGGDDGLLIPCRDIQGRIVALQIRTTIGEYRYFSGRSFAAAKFVPVVHVPRHSSDMDTSAVRLIEGVFKATKATLATGILSLGLPNGGAWAHAIPLLNQIKPRTVLVTPDADVRTNQGISASLAREVNELASRGYEVVIEAWTADKGKGLDDVVNAGNLSTVRQLRCADAYRFVTEVNCAAGAPSDARIEARLTLDGLLEHAKADKTYPFRPEIPAAFAALDPTSVEVQRLKVGLQELLPHQARQDFQAAVRKATEHTAKVNKAQKLIQQQATGKRVFALGDQVEVARSLLEGLATSESGRKDTTRLVFDDGALHLYADGVFAPVEHHIQVNRVADFSGSPMVDGSRLHVSASFAQGVVSLAQSRVAQPGFFQHAAKGIAFNNGFVVIDPQTHRPVLQPHSRDHRVRFRYDFDYVPNANPKRFLALLDRMFVGREDKDEVIAFLQEFAGACAAGEATRFGKAVILVGEGNDGKSTLLAILSKAMPNGSVSAVAPQSMGDKYSRASLAGKLLNCVADLPEQDIMDAGSLKAVITGDPVEARNPYARPFVLLSRAGQAFSCNRLAPTKDTSVGFRRRWVIIRLETPINAAEVNEYIADEIIRHELPEILSWMIEGLARRMANNHYTTPRSSEAALDDWLRKCDQAATYLDDALVVLTPEERADSKGWTGATVVYDDYRIWAKANGHNQPFTSTNFGTRMKSLLKLAKKEGKRADGNYYPVRFKSDLRLKEQIKALAESNKEIDAVFAAYDQGPRSAQAAHAAPAQATQLRVQPKDTPSACEPDERAEDDRLHDEMHRWMFGHGRYDVDDPN